jgi:hypothetical protein
MKVTGPGHPPAEGAGPPKGAGAPDEADAAKKSGKAAGGEKPEAAGRTFAETLAAGRHSSAAAGAPAAAGVNGAAAADPLTSDIAADLQAGKIDPKAALDRVVERVLDQQLGADAPAAVREQLRAALRETINSDPLLTERLRGLG